MKTINSRFLTSLICGQYFKMMLGLSFFYLEWDLALHWALSYICKMNLFIVATLNPKVCILHWLQSKANHQFAWPQIACTGLAASQHLSSSVLLTLEQTFWMLRLCKLWIHTYTKLHVSPILTQYTIPRSQLGIPFLTQWMSIITSYPNYTTPTSHSFLTWNISIW